MNTKEKLIWYSNEFNLIKDIISNKSSLSYEDFLRIRNFKLQNSSRASEQQIKDITEEAFVFAEKDLVKEAINKLCEIHGVAIPIASTILAMRFPSKFAIIDRRVISELNKEEWLHDYLNSSEIYEKYLKLIREKAKKKNKSLREYEKELFELNFTNGK